jgi:hypothetical protein
MAHALYRSLALEVVVEAEVEHVLALDEQQHDRDGNRDLG